MTRIKHGMPGVYNASGLSLTDGDGCALAVNSAGELIVNLESGDIEIGSVELKDSDSTALANIKAANTARTTATVVLATQHIDAAGVVGGVQGGIAANAADSGNPVKVGGKYTAAGVTLDDGDRGDVALDSKSNINVNLNTLISGEDQTNNLLRTEERYSYTNCSADTQIKASAGFIHTITFAQIDAAPTAGTIIVYDNTAESGTIVYSETFDTTVFRGYTVTLDVSCATGIYIGFTTTADIGVTISWR